MALQKKIFSFGHCVKKNPKRTQKTNMKLTFKLVVVLETWAGAKAEADPARARRVAVNFMVEIIDCF